MATKLLIPDSKPKKNSDQTPIAPGLHNYLQKPHSGPPLKPEYYGIAPTGGGTLGLTDGQDTGGGGPTYDPVAAANEEAKSRARAQNENTRALVDQQYALLGSFGKARDVKLANIAAVLEAGQKLLLENYGIALGGLEGNAKDNDAAEADASFSNVANAVRERSDIMSEAASQGAGETDLLRAQLAALRNYSSNQGEVNRSFFDTLRSINNAVGSLNSDTASGRTNLFMQSESDNEAAWANFYNQVADTWTQISNIENSNTNVDGISSEAYQKKYSQAGDEAARAAGSAYARKGLPEDWNEWDGKGSAKERSLTSSNRAATVNLGGPQKRPEGATLRKW